MRPKNGSPETHTKKGKRLIKLKLNRQNITMPTATAHSSAGEFEMPNCVTNDFIVDFLPFDGENGLPPIGVADDTDRRRRSKAAGLWASLGQGSEYEYHSYRQGL